MVKVQKPTPKTLNKSEKKETKIKASLNKVKKPQQKLSKVNAIAEQRRNAAKILSENIAKSSNKTPKNIKGKNIIKDNLNKEQKKKENLKSKPQSDSIKKSSPKSSTEKIEKNLKISKNPKSNQLPGKETKIAHVMKAKTSASDDKPKQKQNKNATIAIGGKQQRVPKLKKVNKNKDTLEPYKKQQKRPVSDLKLRKINKVLNKRQQSKLKKAAQEKLKPKPTIEYIYEPLPFEEEKFNEIVKLENVKEIAKGLKKQVEQEVKAKKTAIFSDYKYVLDVTSFKIPNCPKRMVKLNLEHSLVDKDDDVLIIVADLQRGSKVDYEPTIQHYEDLFREAGVEGLKIMPFNQLRNEYKTFESVRKLSNTYEYFLCDGRVVGHVVHFCGKIFQKPRTTFHAVHLDNPKKIKSEIEKGLSRTAYKRLMKGDMISIPLGNHKFTSDQLAENVMGVVAQLKESYPGGLANIRSMYLKISITGTTSLPIYISLAQPPAETPYVVGLREQHMLALKKEANAVLSKFILTKEADILKLSKDQVKKRRNIKEAMAALHAANDSDDNDEDGDGGEKIIVPLKKAKRDDGENMKKGEPVDNIIEEGVTETLTKKSRKVKAKNENDTKYDQPQDSDGDGQNGIPAKKARKDEDQTDPKKTLETEEPDDTDEDSRLEGNDCDDIDDVEDDDEDDEEIEPFDEDDYDGSDPNEDVDDDDDDNDDDDDDDDAADDDDDDDDDDDEEDEPESD